MEKYTKVDTTPPETRNGCPNSKMTKKYVFMYITYLLICSGTWASYFSFGLSMGSPTVIIPQMRREANSTDAVSVQMASWMSSTFCYSGLVGAVILAILARLIGRKFSYIFVCVTSLIGFTIFYFSKTAIQIIISEIILGPLSASPITLSVLILTEYTSPRYRGIFLTLKSASYLWGIWVANAIGTFFHWRNICILGLICTTYSIITALFWPESPYWLVSQNRFDDCVASHRWLNGCTKEAELELEALIKSRNHANSMKNKQSFLRKFTKMITTKVFYKPILLGLLILSLYHSSGKIACGMYAIDIIKRITKTEFTAYMGMLILDGITVLGMYIGCGLSKILKRRTLLLISTSVGISFLYCLSLYLYLIRLRIFPEVTIISMLLLTGYSLSISVGPMIMITSILGELIPVKYRSMSVLILGCAGNLLMGIFLIISPFVLNFSGPCGLFLFFAISASVCTIITYKVLPETKDKTILEIQECLLNGNTK